MAPTPTNNTCRLWIGYTSKGVQHEIMTRYVAGTTSTEMNDQGDAIIALLKTAMLPSDTLNSMRYSLAGTDFSIPLPLTPVAGTYTSAPEWTEDPESAFLGFCGREYVNGKRVRFQFFTPCKFSTTWPADNRYAAGENANVDGLNADFANVLYGSGAVVPAVGIGGSTFSLYTYTNIAKNAYWQRKQRT